MSRSIDTPATATPSPSLLEVTAMGPMKSKQEPGAPMKELKVPLARELRAVFSRGFYQDVLQGLKSVGGSCLRSAFFWWVLFFLTFRACDAVGFWDERPRGGFALKGLEVGGWFESRLGGQIPVGLVGPADNLKTCSFKVAQAYSLQKTLSPKPGHRFVSCATLLGAKLRQFSESE